MADTPKQGQGSKTGSGKGFPKGKQIRKESKGSSYDEASTFGKKWNW